MNVLFLTLVDFNTVKSCGIYQDLLRETASRGHRVYAVSPMEGADKDSYLIEEDQATILKLKIGKTQKTNVIQKGISTLMIETQFVNGIKRFFSNVRFDLVLYSTPPITLYKAIEYVKNRDGAKTYLLLKDIFPQNAVDMGMMKKTGVKGFLYRRFRAKEKRLYAVSDHIGCMSQANADYVLKHNPEVAADKTEVCPNCIEIQDIRFTDLERRQMREKYGIPQDKTVFVYGGNLGKPQGIPFLIDCLKTQVNNSDVFFLIVGDGTEYGKLERFVEETKPSNIKLMPQMPREDYDLMVASCDVGMIFLDHRFTIPNFPSRLLCYMQAKLPVIACTDVSTDIGRVIVDGQFGWWCESRDVSGFGACIDHALQADRTAVGQIGYTYLCEHYTVKHACDIIFSKF